MGDVCPYSRCTRNMCWPRPSVLHSGRLQRMKEGVNWKHSFDQFSLMAAEISGSFLVYWFGNTSFIVVWFMDWTHFCCSGLTREHPSSPASIVQTANDLKTKIQNTHTLFPFALQGHLRVQWIPDMYRVKKYWTQVSLFSLISSFVVSSSKIKTAVTAAY